VSGRNRSEVRNLGTGWWILLIVFFPLVGGIAWLVAGRPQRGGQRRSVPWRTTRTSGLPENQRPRPVAPDDDPEFLQHMRRGNAEQEHLLKKWEDHLRRREQRLRDGNDDPPGQAPS
jgi:hypothetical protein